jgi:hypothetical protein
MKTWSNEATERIAAVVGRWPLRADCVAAPAHFFRWT